MKNIYLDHAATTPVDSAVKKAMEPYFNKEYGNPRSLHTKGRRAREAVEDSRKTVASILNCKPDEIIFTAGGTSSDNLAIFGVTRAHQRLYPNSELHFITTNIEHPAVLEVTKHLEKENIHVTYLKVNSDGLIDLNDLKKSITKSTFLISIMYANNEIGTIQPIAEIAKIITEFNQERENKIYFHTDACQAAGYLDLDTNKLGVDLMTINGSKIYGPKGIGVLFIKKSTPCETFLFGGGQEKGLWPGTENVAGIVGMAKALELASINRVKESKRLERLRDYFIQRIKQKIPKVLLNGHPQKRLPNNINLAILGVEGETLLLHLDKLNIYVSTGSACASVKIEPSHVIVALGLPDEYIHSSMRFTLGKSTTKANLDYVIKSLCEIVPKLRKMSAVKSA